MRQRDHQTSRRSQSSVGSRLRAAWGPELEQAWGPDLDTSSPLDASLHSAWAPDLDTSSRSAWGPDLGTSSGSAWGLGLEPSSGSACGPDLEPSSRSAGLEQAGGAGWEPFFQSAAVPCSIGGIGKLAAVATARLGPTSPGKTCSGDELDSAVVPGLAEVAAAATARGQAEFHQRLQQEQEQHEQEEEQDFQRFHRSAPSKICSGADTVMMQAASIPSKLFSDADEHTIPWASTPSTSSRHRSVPRGAPRTSIPCGADENAVPWASAPSTCSRRLSSARSVGSIGSRWALEESTCSSLSTSRRVLCEINSQGSRRALEDSTCSSRRASSNSQARRALEDSTCSSLNTSRRMLRESNSQARRALEESTCSSLNTSRRVLREINSQARFEALHRDGDCRRMRRELVECARQAREDEEARKLLNPTPRRAWDRSWANQQPAAYTRKLVALEEKRRLEAKAKEEAELRECSFGPRFFSTEAPRRRRLAKVRQQLHFLAEQQQEWARQLEALRSEETRFRENGSANEAAAVTERHCRNGMLQVLHELTALEDQALTLSSRAIRYLPSRVVDAGCPARVAAAASLEELCPSFDLGILPWLRREAASLLSAPSDTEHAWEVPGTTSLRPPLPVPVSYGGFAPDEAKPCTWSSG